MAEMLITDRRQNQLPLREWNIFKYEKHSDENFVLFMQYDIVNHSQSSEAHTQLC